MCAFTPIKLEIIYNIEKSWIEHDKIKKGSGWHYPVIIICTRAKLQEGGALKNAEALRRAPESIRESLLGMLPPTPPKDFIELLLFAKEKRASSIMIS